VANHPSLRELRNTVLGSDHVLELRDHLADCLVCRVRLARIAQTEGLPGPTPNVVERILEASSRVPGVSNIPIGRDEHEPEAGEVWRIGLDEALLVWVRRNFLDGALDVIPVVLDVELADEQTLIVGADSSPFDSDLGVMVALRTHVSRGSFINRVGVLDISELIEEVIAATREGRTPSAAVGPDIEFANDDRIEYRQALRDLLDDLSPSNWSAHALSDRPSARNTSRYPGRDDLRDLKAQIQERILAAQCLDLFVQTEIAPGRSLQALFKVAYLNTAVVVASVDSLRHALVDEMAVVHACQRVMGSSPDADAVCVAEPRDEWSCVLYSCASMRQAVLLPVGRLVGPEPILSGYGLVDTLSKHLEGAAPAWEITEEAPRGLGSVNFTDIAGRHTQTSIDDIRSQGRRALQPAKKAAWTALPTDLETRVERFIVAVVESGSVDDALTVLRRGATRD
jgi:hypothetical protein